MKKTLIILVVMIECLANVFAQNPLVFNNGFQ